MVKAMGTEVISRLSEPAAGSSHPVHAAFLSAEAIPLVSEVATIGTQLVFKCPLIIFTRLPSYAQKKYMHMYTKKYEDVFFIASLFTIVSNRKKESSNRRRYFKNSGIFMQWNSISSENIQTTAIGSDVQESDSSNAEQKKVNTTEYILCGSIYIQVKNKTEQQQQQKTLERLGSGI